jgi:hypothetical protein
MQMRSFAGGGMQAGCARFLLALFCGLATSGWVSACSCVTLEEPNPKPCARIHAAETIFVGTVLDIENPPFEISPENPQISVSRYRFRVDENISGFRAGDVVDVYSGRQGADCGYHFKKGQRYLVFPFRGAEGDRYFASICSQTGPIDNSTTLLEQLRAARDADRVGSIYGVLQAGQRPYLSAADPRTPDPLRDVPFELSDGIHELRSATDNQGTFAVYSLPPGTYHLSASLPPDLEFARPGSNEPPAPITVAAGDCSSYDLIALPTGRIRGRVIGLNGESLPLARVQLFRRDKYQSAPLLMTWEELQSDKGYFEFVHVSPGDYVLVFNNNEERKNGFSTPRCFYPGVSEIGAASNIHIAPGQKVFDADIHIRGKCSRK